MLSVKYVKRRCRGTARGLSKTERHFPFFFSAVAKHPGDGTGKATAGVTGPCLSGGAPRPSTAHETRSRRQLGPARLQAAVSGLPPSGPWWPQASPVRGFAIAIEGAHSCCYSQFTSAREQIVSIKYECQGVF